MEFKIFANRGKIIEKLKQCDLTPEEAQKVEDIAVEISERYPGDLVLIEVTVCDRR